MARDAYVFWQGSRYSVPWQYVGQQVWVRERGIDIEVYDSQQRIALHARAQRRHLVVTRSEHIKAFRWERSGGTISAITFSGKPWAPNSEMQARRKS